jgi:hypothetical protein
LTCRTAYKPIHAIASTSQIYISAPSVTVQPEHLGDGEIWVEYHPASGKAPEILCPGDHQPPPVTLPLHLSDKNIPPWHPFRTRLDFEQAELFLQTNASNTYIDSQLKLIHAGSPLDRGITLKSAKELHTILRLIPDIELLPEVHYTCAGSNDHH